jgi:alkylated DNA repair dioxygenase AlkB
MSSLITDIQIIENANLRVYQFGKHKSLIDDAVKEVKDHLEIKPECIVYGRKCHQQRNVGFFAGPNIHGYTYSNQTASSIPMGPICQRLLEEINKHFGSEYNGILVNEYTGDGKSTVGWHADSEIGLDPKAGVVAISWGCARPFKIRIKGKTKPTWTVKAIPYQAIQMHGKDFQKYLQHTIPPTKKAITSRISFTFRKHLEHNT